jgi:hypothetical protein
MPCPNSEVVEPGTPSSHHCVCLCAPRANLDGFAALSGRGLERRKTRMETRPLELADCSQSASTLAQ